MSVVDFILNIVGLLLWINWRALHWRVPARPGISLISTLKRAAPPSSRWFFLVGLIGLIFVRAFFYWQIGEALNWVPGVSFGPTSLPFRSDLFGRMLLYSILSFVIVLAVFHLWLLFLSVLNTNIGDDNPQQKLVRLHLGLFERLPLFLKIFVPPVVGILLWLALNPILRWTGIVPPISFRHELEQGAVIGLGTFLAVKFLLMGFLALYLLNSYVYLGERPFWKFVNFTSQRFLLPIKWLPSRVGKIDFLPALAMAGIYYAAEFGLRGLTLLYQKLPF